MHKFMSTSGFILFFFGVKRSKIFVDTYHNDRIRGNFQFITGLKYMKFVSKLYQTAFKIFYIFKKIKTKFITNYFQIINSLLRSRRAQEPLTSMTKPIIYSVSHLQYKVTLYNKITSLN